MAFKFKIFETINITLDGHYTCVYSDQSLWHKYRKQNMFASQEIHQWSLMIKNKCGSQMHRTYAYYNSAQSLLVLLIYAVMSSLYEDYCISAVGNVYALCRLSSSYFFRAFLFSPYFFGKILFFPILGGFVQSGHVYFLYKLEFCTILICLLFKYTFSRVFFLGVATPMLISCALGKFLPLGCLGEISLISA